jgi:D-alanine-D-alanine ligase
MRTVPTAERASTAEGGARSEGEARAKSTARATARHPDRPQADAFDHVLPGHLEPPLEAELVMQARAAFDALECRDFARADFKCDTDGRPCFLEINPLPSFAPSGSFGVHAALLGRPLEDLLAEALGAGLARLGLAR